MCLIVVGIANGLVADTHTHTVANWRVIKTYPTHRYFWLSFKFLLIRVSVVAGAAVTLYHFGIVSVLIDKFQRFPEGIHTIHTSRSSSISDGSGSSSQNTDANLMNMRISQAFDFSHLNFDLLKIISCIGAECMLLLLLCHVICACL